MSSTKIEKTGETKLRKCLGKFRNFALLASQLCTLAISPKRVKVPGTPTGHHTYLIFALCVDVLKDLV